MFFAEFRESLMTKGFFRRIKGLFRKIKSLLRRIKSLLRKIKSLLRRIKSLQKNCQAPLIAKLKPGLLTSAVLTFQRG